MICGYQGKSSLKKIHLIVALPVRVESLLISFTWDMKHKVVYNFLYIFALRTIKAILPKSSFICKPLNYFFEAKASI